MIARLLFEVSGLKLKDINNEIKIFSITYIVEYLIVTGYLYSLILSNVRPGRNEGLPIILTVISILVLGLLWLYIRTFIAGIVVYRNSYVKGHKNGKMRLVVPYDMNIKREQHSVGRYAHVRVARYYITCKYKDLEGRVHRCRTIYFDEDQSKRELRIYVSENNMKKYYTEFI